MLLGQQPKIHLAFGLHHHQPVGNLDWVIAEAYDKAYRPFLDVLERHPSVRISLHYGGFLLEWLREHQPVFLGRLRRLVESGQVEIVGGAYYEPILAMIPDDNKVEQIVHLSQALTRLTGASPGGMWLAERAWEPHLVKSIAEAGLSWTCLDDTHFMAAGLRGSELFGYYQSEEQGQYLQLFPLNSDLRQLMIHSQPEQILDYLRQHATPDGSRLAVVFDDGEKFGGWAHTYEIVYEQGWLDRFFGLLEDNADWLVTTTPSAYRAEHQPWGRLYVPSTTYREMQSWALPIEQARSFDEALDKVSEPYRAFLSGGFWRNFLVKYPEANNLHKKMLAVAAQVAACTGIRLKEPVLAGHPDDADAVARPGAFRDDWVEALHQLWRGQSNDPYWHGVFGGLYVAHLRHANYSALLTAERICDSLIHGEAGFLEVDQTDFDGDGVPEVVVRNKLIDAAFTAKGGALFELDYKPRAFNVLNTLARRPEAYHRKLSEAVLASEAERVPGKTIHELVLTKEPGLERLLHYDWYRRVSLLDHFLHPDSQLESFYNVSYGEQGDFVIEAYQSAVEVHEDRAVVTMWRDGHVWVGQEFWPVKVTKRVTIPKDRALLKAEYEVSNSGDRPVSLWFGVEFNATFLAGNAPDRYYASPEVSISEPHLASKGELGNMTILGMRDMFWRLDYQLRWERPATVWRFPIETISQSEAGFERVYQGSAVMPHWRIELPAGGSWTTWIEQRITQL